MGLVTKETIGKIYIEIRSFDIPQRGRGRGMEKREVSEDTDLLRKSIIREKEKEREKSVFIIR